jgi:pimeloyl-ACP methyl ester carboxylesterase
MTNIAYTTVGSGPTKVIAAHSWLADHRTFAPMFPYLDVDNYTFVFPDYRGYGKSMTITGEYTAREMGRDLVSVADDLGWERFHLVGHSMSGQAAQWIAGSTEYGKRIESLVLICPVPARGFPLDEQGAAFFGGAADSLEVRGQCAAAVTGGRLGPAFSAFVARLSGECVTPEGIRKYLRAWTEEDVSSDLVPYAGAVRVYMGQFDPVLTVEVAKQAIVPHFPHAVIETIDGAAHYPPLETPAYVASLLNTLKDRGAGA